MTSTLQKLENGNIEVTATIPWPEVQKTYHHVVDEFVENTELPGFRKGKAPRDMVEPKLDKSKVYETVLRELIPTIYNDVIKEHNLKPIINPKIEFKDAHENKDWILKIITCERPIISLDDYKSALTELNASKKKKIWLPGEQPADAQGEPANKEEDKLQKATLDEILMALYSKVSANIPALLLENEVNRELSNLVDQTKKLGLTVEQYLASTQRTADGVKKEFEEQAKRAITLEFALEEIADKEGILISDDDIDNILKTAKTDEERTAMEKERYYLASVLRRQKTLDFLATL